MACGSFRLYHFITMKNNTIEMIAPRLTELMIRKIETLTTEWHKPWIADMSHGVPRNLRGTPYRAGNMLMLFFLSELEQYRTPLFLTFNQAKEEGLTVLKGEKSFPVYFWMKYVRNKQTGAKIDYDDYCLLSAAARKAYTVIPVMRYYSVFNIDQTDIAEKEPQRYLQLTQTAEATELSDGTVVPEIDAILDAQSWLCPVELRYGDAAYYHTVLDKIVCPLKKQFPKGADFYGTLLHEMAHSTEHPDRLNRTANGRTGREAYAYDELVAELTAALCGARMGFAPTPKDESVAYLKGWLEKLKQEPEFLFEILGDVNKAARMITDKIT